jgi:MoaA/NifB/PqqE/SkfB family radical SAM enzyme
MTVAQRYLARVPQYTRHARHFWAVTRHGTPWKLVNLARVELERKQRRIHLKGHPYLLIVDPCNYCNLRCPLCPTGIGTLGRRQAMLSLDHFKEYFEPHADHLFEVSMHNWGESLLNKQVFDMIAHAQSRNVGTNLSTNFSDTSSSDLDRLLDSGLEYLIVSLDGTSAASYAKYRVRGKFDRVVENMHELIRRRTARRMKTPRIEWQFIVMQHNESEVGEAEAMARRIGVDLLRFIPVGMPYDTVDREAVKREWYPLTLQGRAYSAEVEQQYGQANKPSPCFYLYRTMVIHPDGGVAPCCVVYKESSDFARLPGDANAIWNNDHYQSARALFSWRTAPSSRPTICDGCDIFRKHPAKQEAQ